MKRIFLSIFIILLLILNFSIIDDNNYYSETPAEIRSQEIELKDFSKSDASELLANSPRAFTANRGQTETEVKQGHGGIRDIEFTVQVLQLLNGGRVPELQTRRTLDVIDVLGRKNILRPLEASTLSSNYVFLRQVEHRLQIEGSQQRHALPDDPAALDRFGRLFGYASGEAFMRTSALLKRAPSTCTASPRACAISASVAISAGR